MIGDDRKLEILYSLREKNQLSRDQSLLTLSSATLGFTITVSPILSIKNINFLMMPVWFLLTTSIISLLLSFGAAIKIVDYSIDFNLSDESSNENLLRKIKSSSVLNKLLNNISLTSYCLSLVFFISIVSISSFCDISKLNYIDNFLELFHKGV